MCGRKGGRQTRCANDRGDHGFAGIAGHQRIQRFGTRMGLGGKAGSAQAIAQGRVLRGVGDDGVARPVRAAQGDQGIDPAASREHAGAQPVRMPRDHVQRRRADRAGGAEDRDLLHARQP